MKPSKEEMTRKLLNSLDTIGQVEPSPFLYAKIRYKIDERRGNQYIFSKKMALKTSLAFFLLLILNVAGISLYSNINNNTNTEESTATATEEYSLTTDNDYYNY